MYKAFSAVYWHENLYYLVHCDIIAHHYDIMLNVTHSWLLLYLPTTYTFKNVFIIYMKCSIQIYICWIDPRHHVPWYYNVI